MMYKEDIERRQMAAKPEINTTATKTAYDAVVDAFTTDLQLVKGLAKVTNIAPDAVRMHNKKDRPDHRADLRVCPTKQKKPCGRCPSKPFRQSGIPCMQTLGSLYIRDGCSVFNT